MPMDVTCVIHALVYCYTLMIFYFCSPRPPPPPQYRHFSCYSGCERELERFDMTSNAKKSSCMRIGPRFHSCCNCITTRNGGEIWGYTIKYLGVHITVGLKLNCCSLSNASAFNCIFGKVGRIAYENVVIELLKAKCLSVLVFAVYYGL